MSKQLQLRKDADPQEKLREFFQDCERNALPDKPVTLGTLFHFARQTVRISLNGSRSPLNAILTLLCSSPATRRNARKLLDGAVAADPLTFTLGDPNGPLVILRVPRKETLPLNTRWEGDLPGTTLASPADVMERAERITWMKKGQWGPYRVRPPRDFISDYLTQMQGRYGARTLRGIMRVPCIDDRGKIRFNPGYDPQTGLFHDKSLTFYVPPNPSLHDARKAAEILLHPFSKYQFDDPVAGQALLLAAIFTAIERPFLPVAQCSSCAARCPARAKA